MNLQKELTTLWNKTNGVHVCSNRELLFGGAALALAGMVLGMLLSPRKTKTLYIGGKHTAAAEQPEEADEE